MLVIRPSKGWTMKRRFSDEQIIGMIKEYEAGVKAQDLCRKYGISDAVQPHFYGPVLSSVSGMGGRMFMA